ncbi:ABC-F family ATP-binding cassette domain-containing protein [Lachnospiraceae bacterium HCP1S3_C3]|nr:ABC-F family ATP-binding cassette domain-containing protein [Lachnospiraceae bacterium]
MNIINIENLTKTFGDRVILSDVSLGINEHDKIGIIGVNGTGKTTLLRMIAGIEEADSGNIIMMNNVTVSMLPQVPVFKKNETIISYVSKGGIKGDSWDKESEAKTILTRLGIGDFSQDINTLSGGQKKRVALARTLINPTDILIMDEPTNHLDNDMTEWLEEYLKKYRGVLIMVTHDRYFLDSVTNKIVEIDNKKLYSYNANYSGYLELKCQREDMEAATERKRKSILRNELKWVMRGARARSTKQKARLNRYEEMKAIRGIEEKQQIELESVYTRLGNKTIEVNNISKAYGEKHIINDFSYIFTKGINVGIVGNNGCGKTTFLDIISGSHEPDGGYVEIGDTVKIGYFTQEIKNMNPEERVIDYVRDIAEFLPTKTGKISASKMLERFLFTSDMQYTRIEKLSGGEKRRLYLLSILMKAPNILILDEPTNDLDISTLTVLEDYIDGFDGIVITVSHDRYFLDRVVDRILAFDGHGNINQYEGGYTDYRNKISGTLEPVNESKEVKVKTEKSQERKRKLSYNEKREYETIDEEIAELEGKIEDIEKGIAEKSSDYSELNRLMEEKAELESELEKKMDRWVYLNELVEEIEG